MPSPFSARLHTLGNAFACVVALTPWVWATLGLIAYAILQSRDLHFADVAFQFYDPLYQVATILLQVCSTGGLVLIGLGIAHKSRRLIWQGALGLGVSVIIACIVAAFILSTVAQFGLE